MVHHRYNNVYLLALAHAVRDPRLHLRPGLVDRQEARFSSALDQLVGLHNERCACEPGIVLLDFGEPSFSSPLQHVCFDLSQKSSYQSPVTNIMARNTAVCHHVTQPRVHRPARTDTSTHMDRTKKDERYRPHSRHSTLHTPHDMHSNPTNLNNTVLDVVVAVLRYPFGDKALAMVLPDRFSRHGCGWFGDVCVCGVCE